MKKRDFILIGGILLVALLSYVILLLVQEEGAYVEVCKLDSETKSIKTVIGKYSLSENGEYSLNGGTNILKIEDGVAYMIYANCPLQSCINDPRAGGKISKTGQTITCMENLLQITVYGAEDMDVDLVS